MKLNLIGDCHGKITQLRKIVRQLPAEIPIVQLGDMGLGFKGVWLYPITHHKFTFIRGNHDDPERCAKNPHYKGDFGYKDGVFWIGGAFSIDKDWRIPGVSWWEGEELSYPRLAEAINLFIASKPKLVLSHEAPSEIGKALLQDGNFREYKESCITSRTAVALQQMFDNHQPAQWVFGHYHRDWSIEKNGTTFTCLDELSTREFEIPENA